MSFNPRDYTINSLMEELYLIERHSKDGSAIEGGCACIEEKHLIGVEGLSKEGVLFATSNKEKKFYDWLAPHARELRKTIDMGEFRIPVSHGGARKSHVFSRCEVEHPSVKSKLVHCLKEDSLKNCRARIKCPP